MGLGVKESGFERNVFTVLTKERNVVEESSSKASPKASLGPSVICSKR